MDNNLLSFISNQYLPFSVLGFTFIANIILLVVIGKITSNNYFKASKFSISKYYIVMLWVPVGYLILGLFYDVKYFILFFISGFAGILGEWILSILWDFLLDKPIWSYRDESIGKGYTSKLNFLPWTTGALIFLSVGKVFGNVYSGSLFFTRFSYFVIVLLSGSVGVLIMTMVEGILEARNREDKKFLDLKFSLIRFLIFCIPIFTMYLGLVLFKGWKYLLIAIFFAIIGNITEYLYSKYIAMIFGHKLWTYNYLKIDGGHSSFTNLPLWALGGLYFYIIADFVGVI